MLVLGRRMGEHILIGPNIRVTVLTVRGRQVRLGVDAPRDVNVVREELSQPARHRSVGEGTKQGSR